MWTLLAVLLAIVPAAAESVETRAAFQAIDRDGDGKISFEEFQSHDAERPRETPFDAKQAKLAFSMFDANGDEALTIDEFRILAGDQDVRMSIRIPQDKPAPRGYSEIHLLLVLHNLGTVPIEGAHVWYEGHGFDRDRFAAPIIRPGATEEVSITLQSSWHMDISRVPSNLPFALKGASGSILSFVDVQVDLSWFVSALGPPTFDPSEFHLPKFNILVFGPYGSGKSAFINSVHAMVQSSTDGEAMRSFVPVHGVRGHCTVRYHAIEGMANLPLAFWDTWGVVPDQYNGNELELIMRGKLPAGWKMDDQVPLSSEVDEGTAYENRPHAVIFMLPIGWISDPESMQMKKIITELTKLKHLGVNPLVLLARVDEVDASIRDDPSKPGDQIKNAVKAAASLLGIPSNDVVPNVNYVEESKKTFAIDRHLWSIVHRVLSQSKHYLMYLNQQEKQDAKTRNPGTPHITQKLAKCEDERNKHANHLTLLKTENTRLHREIKELKASAESMEAAITLRDRWLEGNATKADDELRRVSSNATSWSRICLTVISLSLIGLFWHQPEAVEMVKRGMRTLVQASVIALEALVMKIKAWSEIDVPQATVPSANVPQPAAAVQAPTMPAAAVEHNTGLGAMEDSGVLVKDPVKQETRADDGTRWLGVEN